MKGGALICRVRKFGAGYFALKKSKTMTACVGRVLGGWFGEGYPANPHILPILILTRVSAGRPGRVSCLSLTSLDKILPVQVLPILIMF